MGGLFDLDGAGLRTFDKYCLLFLNCLLFFCGLAVLGVGAWGVSRSDTTGGVNVLTAAWDYFYTVALLLLVVGVVMMLLALFGTAAVLLQNRGMLILFALLLLVIVVLLLIAGVVGLVPLPNQDLFRAWKCSLVLYSFFMNMIEDKLEKEFVVSYFHNKEVNELMDYVQSNFQCCGIGNETFQDWDRNPFFACKALNGDYRRCAVPTSCCIKPSDGSEPPARCGDTILLQSEVDAAKSIYTMGCLEAVQDWASSSIFLVVAIALIIMLIPICQIVLAILLIGQIGDNRSSVLQENRRIRTERWAMQSNSQTDYTLPSVQTT